jgi:hypothetical protein
MNFYVGLETTDANARFGRIVREALTFAGEEVRP